MYGFVYIAYCDAFPGLYKIGSTRSAPSERLRQLGAPTSSPACFELVCAGEFDNPESVEKEIHRIWDAERLNPRREFFRLSGDHLSLLCAWIEEESGFAWTDHYYVHKAKGETE